ncbi:dynamin-related protein 3A-like isoform X7 [Magnolia sinica]|uniref:dynamin-related protein 3A-like isoform X7 n=1 Tax=Magnolia sinica TaxID=86752 RepID=UPI0026594943|nr:dynamin-related protein 3A-like isoform X7 [Magnolia sinica]XP_058089422.1 dynamin-related protein 3A-like isoform X7 [Magnolia sinica]XP_058089423.1 dynamin-related protein 3A-like isoform X7 [Magnolia sinica]
MVVTPTRTGAVGLLSLRSGEEGDEKHGTYSLKDGVKFCPFCTQPFWAFSSMVEGKTRKCQHQSFLEVDPCDDSTDEDIRTTIQNATGPKSALFVPEAQGV